MATLQDLENRIERLEQEVNVLKAWIKPTLLSLEPMTHEELEQRRKIAEKIFAFAESKRGTGIVLSDIVMEWRERWRD